MNAVHDSIVSRFRAGETAVAIGLTVGYSAHHVRRILKAKALALPRRGRRFEFQSRPDGEYCRCSRCARLGYGEDAWHPATAEFWRLMNGALHFNQCKACITEVAEHKHGFVRIAA